MAIAYTNSASIANWSASNPASASFDCNGGDILIVGVFGNSSMSNVTATYNGTSMTRLSFFADIEGNKQACFYLVNPSSGSNTLAVTRTSGANLSVVASAYSGVDTTDPIDDSVTNIGTSSSPWTTSAVTVSDSNNWLVAAFRDTDNAVSSADTVSFRVTSTTVLEEIWDSAGIVGATGSTTVTYTITGPDPDRLSGHTLISLNAGGASAGFPFSQAVIIA